MEVPEPTVGRRRSLAALLPAALLGAALIAGPAAVSPAAAPHVSHPRSSPPVAQVAFSGNDRLAVRGQRLQTGTGATLPAAIDPLAARSPASEATATPPGFSVSRGALAVLGLTYLGIGALAAAGIWSYVRRGRW